MSSTPAPPAAPVAGPGSVGRPSGRRLGRHPAQPPLIHWIATWNRCGGVAASRAGRPARTPRPALRRSGPRPRDPAHPGPAGCSSRRRGRATVRPSTVSAATTYASQASAVGERSRGARARPGHGRSLDALFRGRPRPRPADARAGSSGCAARPGRLRRRRVLRGPRSSAAQALVVQLADQDPVELELEPSSSAARSRIPSGEPTSPRPNCFADPVQRIRAADVLQLDDLALELLQIGEEVLEGCWSDETAPVLIGALHQAVAIRRLVSDAAGPVPPAGRLDRLPDGTGSGLARSPTRCDRTRAARSQPRRRRAASGATHLGFRLRRRASAR